jgi:hypothetical protein
MAKDGHNGEDRLVLNKIMTSWPTIPSKKSWLIHLVNLQNGHQAMKGFTKTVISTQFG